MMSFNVHEAKTHFSKLLDRVGKGEEVVIAKAGEPVARIVPFSKPKAPRKPGKDKIVIRSDFDAPLPEFDA
jgi:prevent-host-death family protein